jgi:Fic family protein
MDQKLASGNVQLQLQVLDELLQAWVMSQSTVPKDLEELVRAKMLAKLPTPPPGKKFAVDQKTARAVLVNQ